MTRLIVLLAIAAMFFFGACTVSKPAMIILDESDAGAVIEMKKGDMIEIVLEGNPTTGFTWETDAVDETILEPEADPVYETPTTNLVGAGGRFIFVYDAVEEGETPLRLIYHRPWEDTTPLKMFDITVVVR